MTSSIFKAQLWSLFRLTWPELLVRFITPLTLVYVVTRITGIVDYFTGTIILECLLLCSLTSLLWLKSFEQRSPSAFPLQLGFVHPVPDQWLAGLPLAWLMLTNTLLYVTLSLVIQSMLGHPFAVLAMIPFILMTTAGIAMVAWSSTRIVERGVGAVLLGILTIRWFQGGLSELDPLSVAPLDWSTAFRSTYSEIFLRLSGTLLFSLLCIVFIRRQRHGDTEPLLGWRNLFADSFSERLERPTGFASARSAQLWFELRRVGFRGAGITLAALFLLAAGLSAIASESDSLGELLFFSGLFFSPVVLVVTVTEGMLGLNYRGNALRLSPYEATLPLAESTSIRLKIEVALGVTLAGWSAIGLVVLFGILLILDPNTPGLSPSQMMADVAERYPSIAMWIAIGFALFVATSAAAVLILASVGYLLPRLREHAAWSIALALCALVPIPLDIIGELLDRDFQPLLDAWLVAWGVFLVGIAAFSLHKLHKEGHCSTSFVWGCTLCWTLLLAMALKLFLDAGLDPFQARPSVVCFAAGLASIPLASVAWAPLSLAALRHQ